MGKKKVLVATTSSGKLGEIQDILGGLPIKLVMLSQIKLPRDFAVVEDGKTFGANARIKAVGYGKESGLLTLADDSGLCVDALGGKPGIRTARYAPGSDEARWQKLLGELADVPKPKRTAQFVSAVALYDPRTRKTMVREGKCFGKIAFGPKGSHGFGYDPVFIVDKLDKHFAQLTRPEKNQVSHRALAVKKIKPVLEQVLNEA
jgi:XTP/dITP diphosphohydrolase